MVLIIYINHLCKIVPGGIKHQLDCMDMLRPLSLVSKRTSCLEVILPILRKKSYINCQVLFISPFQKKKALVL